MSKTYKVEILFEELKMAQNFTSDMLNLEAYGIEFGPIVPINDNDYRNCAPHVEPIPENANNRRWSALAPETDYPDDNEG